MSAPTVYLAGPITGLSFQGCTDWRAVASDLLNAQGLRGLSPMRSKEYLLAETKIGDCYDQTILSCARGITTRDRFDSLRCDMLLVNLLGAERVSIGTMIELGWADSVRTPIILVIEDNGNPHDHAMVREIAGFRVNTLQHGIETAIAVLR